MKGKSVFRRIFKSTVAVMVIFAFVVAAAVSVVVCRNAYKDEQNKSMNILSGYTDNVKTIIEETVQQSDYILKYNYLCGNIAKVGSTTEEKYTFSYDIAQYFKSIESEKSSYRVYFSNPELFEGIYLYNIKRLNGSEHILEKLASADIFWSDEMKTDIYGNMILSFYREISEGNILECNVVIPKATEAGISIVEKVPPETLSSPINENYSAIIHTGGYVRIYAKVVFGVYAVMLIFLALMIFVVYMQNIKISDSVTQFIETLEKIDVENIDKNEEIIEKIHSEETENKEIAVMKRVIYELLQRGHQAAKQRYEAERQIRETEYRLLQSQIDPHTLYNSLSAIKYNAFLKNDVKTTELVENMVLYYRAVLNRGKEIFTVEDEMRMLGYYIKINEFSHDRSYNFTVDVTDDVKKIEIMHLMLQPFAENAVLHGLIGREREAELKISCRMEGEYLVFKISDNGYGMTEEQLEHLRDLEHYDESYGIKNVYRRMKLVYGEDSDIIIDSKENEGTWVTVKFRPNPEKKNSK